MGWVWLELGEEVALTTEARLGRVVVLDENEVTRDFVCAALEEARYEVVPVASTLGLRKALETRRPTVVILRRFPTTHP